MYRRIDICQSMARDHSVELHSLPSPSPMHLHVPNSNYSDRSFSPIQITREHYLDDGTSTALSSPMLPSEPCRSPAPLLGGSAKYSLTEPQPSFNPPSYRAVVSMPSYASWTDKYSRLPGDIESVEKYSRGFGLRYFSWRIWAVIVAIVVVTVISIAVALTQHQSN